MEKNKAEQFLTDLSKNAEIRKYMENYTIPEGTEKAEALADVAARFGYEITKEDLMKAIEKQASELDDSRQAAEKEVVELSTDDLDTVAGGALLSKGGEPEHIDCKETFKDKENCWYNDGCDYAFNMYDDYHCNVGQKTAYWGSYGN